MTRRNFLLVGTASMLVLTKSLLSQKTTPSTQRVPMVSTQQSGLVNFPPPVRLKSNVMDHSLLCDCLAEIETGGNDTLVGPCGELSKYQISYPVWVQHSTPRLSSRDCFQRFCHTIIADALALRHVQHLDNTLPRISRREVKDRAYVIGWAWHGGMTSWTCQNKLSALRHAALHDYAERLSNLYHDRANRH